MTAAAVLMAIRRFIAAQGKPKRILCDNAVQFWMASQMTTNVRWQSYGKDTYVDRNLRRSGIDWSFIPQLSPWAGGVYERLVGLVKKALRHATGRRILLLDELHTVVKEIESLLNHRPLTYVYDEADTVVLSPIDLIRPTHNEDSHVYTAESSDDDDEYKPRKTNYDKLVRLWKRSAHLLNQFWRVFVREYLMGLRERHQMTHKQGYTATTEPRLGQVVLVKDEVMPRGLWKCARITDLYYSRDGSVRSVQVKNVKGNFLKGNSRYSILW
ncbi:Integrase core domain containing protein [Aphelenchoides avenae]|nr:Integrase core domain containing protein [Aphelenchus avenae]